MSGNPDNLRGGVDSVLGPVIDRLRKEAEADLRIAKEDFARELAEIRRKQQAAFFTSFAIFAGICVLLLGGTWMSLDRMGAAAAERARIEDRRTERLGALEEETRARLESLVGLERRLRVELLEKGASAPAAAQTPAQEGTAGEQPHETGE